MLDKDKTFYLKWADVTWIETLFLYIFFYSKLQRTIITLQTNINFKLKYEATAENFSNVEAA